MKIPSRGFMIAMLLIGSFGIAVFFLGEGSSSGNGSHTKAGRERRNLSSFALAVRSYQQELNREPPVSPNQFYASLRGANSKGFTFLVPARDPDSESGAYRDAWGNPYQIFRGDSGWLIRSAGPNRIFDDQNGKGSDDMTVFIPSISRDPAEVATPNGP